jgi:hypothetical protein
MAKGQMRSGREAKKPKKSALAKTKPTAGPAPVAAPPPMPVTIKQKNS